MRVLHRARLHPRSVRLLQAGLLVIAVVGSLRSGAALVLHHPAAVDIEIPLRATERWLRGEEPYLASAFELRAGPDLPYLYPPVLLPVIAPLLSLPRLVIWAAWLVACGASALAALHRLAIPPRWWPLFLISPPFAEPLIGGNVQLIILALYTWLFFGAPEPARAFAPLPRDPAGTGDLAGERGSALRVGLAAASIAALKISQLHAWFYVLVHRTRAAILGAVLVAGVGVLTLPLTGFEVWLEWLAQLRRAADPAWVAGGISLARHIPAPLALLLVVVALLLVPLVPRERAGAWVGILSVVGAPSLHVFGVLPLLPAFLAIRRELALLAAVFVSTLTEFGLWVAIAIVAVSYAIGERFPALRASS